MVVKQIDSIMIPICFILRIFSIFTFLSLKLDTSKTAIQHILKIIKDISEYSQKFARLHKICSEMKWLIET